MENFIGLISFLVLMIAGYLFGSYAERKHYKSILQREEQYRNVVLMALRLPRVSHVEHTQLVSGSVVISVDYFKRFLASLRMLVGGRLNSYESLLDRARREAILRMQKQASDMNASSVYNIKFETSSISKGQKDRVGSIEVLAYGTAIVGK
ncbi:YbjQ family protein [Reinekea sp. G2M2-21]|uniref:YbjQ family protein n=1 Tax=Reinekea sp. G2M2-21 TaxID=2788942 RepID=UPI0018AB8D9C|nr:YbjQ family protein [Reinekea sp. G2M2-21]